MSIGSHDDETIKYCESKGISYQAFSPLRRVDLTSKSITAIASSHSVSAAQVALRWITQQKILVATSPGTKKTFVEEDLNLFSFTLTDKEMEALSAL
jgi:diketogulonate reductase-like aldo/keto reductase